MCVCVCACMCVGVCVMINNYQKNQNIKFSCL